jgi:TetR/AcrR family transcriptional regulator, mexJK operon transcriptional repressor
MQVRLNDVKRERSRAVVPPKEPEAEIGGKAESILAAAKRTFLARGFGAVSMDAIAHAAGVSKATVYAHFTSKEELFGAMIGRECEQRFASFSAQELDPHDVAASLTVLGRRFLELILSPDAIALHRIILGEVTRFPALGEVFWHAGPKRNFAQIEAFMRRAADAGALDIGDTQRAAEQFIGLVRGETQLQHLLRIDATAEPDVAQEISTGVATAVATFLRAFRPASDAAVIRHRVDSPPPGRER